MTLSMPKDDNATSMQLVPDKTALAITYDTTISSETEITLNAATRLIEVNAINEGVFLKYKTVAGGTAVSSTNFDEYIQSGSTRHYKIPLGITVIAVIERTTTANVVIIEK